MTAESTAADRRDAALAGTWLHAAPRLAVGLAAGAVAFGLMGEFTGLAWSDTLWLLHVAGRILDGSRLYRDIIEVNPPLVFWLGLPIVQLARWLGLDPLTLWRLVLALALTASVVMTARLLRAWWALPWLAFVLFVVPGRSVFGDREHLILAALLPWLASAVHRLRGEPAPSWVGGLAALAFALKPHYAPLGIAVLWLEARRVGWRAALQLPEHRVTAGLLALYALAIASLTPAYMEVVHTYGSLYSEYLGASLPDMIIRRSVGVAWLALLCCLVVRRAASTTDHAPAELLALLVVVSLGAVVLQGKGLWYHYYPMIAAAILLFASLRTTVTQVLACVVAVALAIMRLPQAAGLPLENETRDRSIISELTEGPRPASLGVLDPSGDLTPFRYAFYAEIPWAPRWPFPWPLNLPRSERTDSVLAGEVAALTANPPDLILIRATDDLNAVDVGSLLAELPAADTLLRRYQEGPRVAHYRVLRQKEKVGR